MTKQATELFLQVTFIKVAPPARPPGRGQLGKRCVPGLTSQNRAVPMLTWPQRTQKVRGLVKSGLEDPHLFSAR